MQAAAPAGGGGGEPTKKMNEQGIHLLLVNDRQCSRPNIRPNNGLPNIRQPNIQ
jgi:hypothetical protein